MMKKSMVAIFSLMMVISVWKGTSYAVSAEDNYKWYCSQCHGLSGKGDGINVTKDMAVTPRNHASAADMSKLSDADLTNAIADGGPANSKSALMPPFGKTLTADEIKDLVAYLRKLCNCTHQK